MIIWPPVPMSFCKPIAAPVVTHSPIGASSFWRILNCPGSRWAGAGIERPPLEAAEFGTLAHDVAAAAARFAFFFATKEPVYPDNESRLIATWWVGVLAAIWDSLLPDMRKMGIEESFSMADLHPLAHGTADAWIYDLLCEILYVPDLKTGRGHVVEVEEASGYHQTMYYAVGVCRKYGYRPREIHLIIAQPRAFHPEGAVRTKVVTLEELEEFERLIVSASEATDDPMAPLNAGEWCHFCPAAPTCPRLREQAEQMIALSAQFDVATLGQYLDKLPQLKSKISALESFAYSQATKGIKIPGWMLANKRGTRVWTETDEKVIEMLELFFGLTREQILKEPEVKSPTQIELLLTSDQVKDLAESGLIDTKINGTVLVPRSAKKTEVLPKLDALSVFTKRAHIPYNKETSK